ncbi:hypothetical protein CR205_14165 [Alteribacter lacisalsi]|uniref:Uncharacterized protein n=1 Tax=Alteribacter lacisalsi TaxID=2045244 RepID=A0A2W0H757_9BACI|nr:SLAP domain-containing protein [Alteribacter lacisalsi]PYZ96821.1 hypothetical protein CR205_14165 [Alteribacter lacisalsi]
MFNKKLLIGTTLVMVLAAGCGAGTTPSSQNMEAEEEPGVNHVYMDEKLLHRMAQRGYEPDAEAAAIEEQAETDEDESGDRNQEEEGDSAYSHVTGLAAEDDWALTELIINEADKERFTDEQLAYFAEDQEERFPPVKEGRVQAVASVIYQQDDSLLLMGVLRNGTENESFSLERLEGSVLTLMDSNLSSWARTSFSADISHVELEAGQAVPFKQAIPMEDVHHPEFDFEYFQYFLTFQLSSEEEPADAEEEESETEEENEDQEDE